MEIIGKIVVYIIMFCAVVGAIASIVKEESELGNQFLEGINSIGAIFLPVAGIMASAPFITKFVSTIFGPLFQAVGADPAMAATTFIAVDMGGYQLAEALASTKESWIMAMTTGYMAGATIVFSIPVGLKMIGKKDHKYLALGMMSGILTIPIGVLTSSLFIALNKPFVRDIISTDAASTYQLLLSYMQIFRNLIPLIIICAAIAIGLLIKPDAMIKGFIVFGKVMDSVLRLVFVFCVVEYFTGLFSTLFGVWGFDPIIADAVDQVRALEVAGAIGIMLCGAFPMVYLIKKYLAKPLNVIGKKFGLSTDATTGLLAAAANVLALFAMIKDMNAEDKVKTIAFSVCGAFLIGDHLAFTANFQPNLILPIMIGKLVAGVCAVIIAVKIAVPKAKKLEELSTEV
ncbi:ethanolamine utilization protein EutH [Clostridium sp. MB05]